MDQQSNSSGPAMAIQKHFLSKGKMDTCSQWGPALKGILCCERSIPVRSIEEGEGLCEHGRGNQIGCKFKWHQTTLGTYHRLAPDIIFLYCDNHMQELNPLQIVFKSGRIGTSVLPQLTVVRSYWDRLWSRTVRCRKYLACGFAFLRLPRPSCTSNRSSPSAHIVFRPMECLLTFLSPRFFGDLKRQCKSVKTKNILNRTSNVWCWISFTLIHLCY